MLKLRFGRMRGKKNREWGRGKTIKEKLHHDNGGRKKRLPPMLKKLLYHQKPQKTVPFALGERAG